MTYFLALTNLNILDKNWNSFLIGAVSTLRDLDDSEEGFLILGLSVCSILANVDIVRSLIMTASIQVHLIIDNSSFISELAVAF
jgi:hypothetical protein